MIKIIDQLWIEARENVFIVGVTEAFQEDAGDVAYVNIAPVGKITPEDTLFNIEASKATIEVPAPFEGEIIEINQDLLSNPLLLNATERSKNWVVKMKNIDLKAFESAGEEG